MKNRKFFKINDQAVNVRVSKNVLEITSKFKEKENAKLSVTYPSEELAQTRFDKYDEDNADAFVNHFNNPYLIKN